MKLRMIPFVEFAYGDKRRDRSTVLQTMTDMKKDYDPVTDRYKQFREALGAYEAQILSASNFKALYTNVTSNKAAAYKTLVDNYLNLKEDHGLIWEGPQRVSASLGGLEVYMSWYLRTDASNLRRVIFMNFRKDPLPRKQEKGLLTLMQLAEPQSAGVGILNVQASTLVVGTRLDHGECEFLEQRARRFVEIANAI